MNNLYGQPYQTVSPPYTSSSVSYVPSPPTLGFGSGGGGGGGGRGGGGYIETGSLVYTTSARPDGQIIYSIFRAEPRSYQTAQGRVDGIQWEIVEVTPVLPVNIPPAGRDFFAAWGSNGEKERQRMIDKWQFEQSANIGRREDPRGSVRTYAAAAERRAQALAAEEDMVLREQERRGRRMSSNATYGTSINNTNDYAPPYSRARSKSYSRYERADEDLARAMNKIDLERAEFEEQQRRARRRSVSRGPIGRKPSIGRLPDYAIPPTGTRSRRASMAATYPTAAEYSQGANYATYASPPSPISITRGGGGGSYVGQQTGILSPTGGPVYPPGHPLAGRPIPGLQPHENAQMNSGSVTSYRSPSPRPQFGTGGVGGVIPNYRSSSPRPEAMYRSSSPRPDVGIYRSSSPRPDVQSIYRSSSPRPDAGSSISYRSSSPRPEAIYRSSSRAPSPVPGGIHPPVSFLRPPSMAFPYTYFDPILISPDLNRLYKEFPPLPAVLVPHDVHSEDWNQCINDLITYWFVNKRSSNEIIPKKPAKMVAQLINVWNASFFAPRGVELTLYRGRQRCSGPQAGSYDAYLDIGTTTDDDDDDDDDYSSSTLSSDSNEANSYEYLGYGTTSRYIPADSRWMADSRRAEKARREAAKAKKMLQQRQRERERSRRRKTGFPYSLYLNCVGDGQPPLAMTGASAAYAAAISGGKGRY